MPRTPSIPKIFHQLTDTVKRMDTFETNQKDILVRLGILEKWHEQTEFAKQVLKEYEETHPEVKDNKNYGKALAALTAAVTALTAIVLAIK